MKKFILLILTGVLFLTGCSGSTSSLEHALNETYGQNFIVTNKYKDNTLTYIAARDENNNYYRFTIDADNRIIFSNDFDKYQKDLEIKEKLKVYLPDDYYMLLQYNINRDNTCDIYLFTDYTLNLSQMTRRIRKIKELENCDITYHTASVASKGDLETLTGMIEKELKQKGIYTGTVEIMIKQYVNDYNITEFKKGDQGE